MLKLYFLGTMGLHLNSMVMHVKHKARNDFMEMFLHHGVTLLLYGLSYYLNRIECGLIIMYLHDWADIPCSFVRCFSETVFSNITIISAVSMVILWFYSRLYVFP
jgi:ceramide synthetase